MTTSRRRFAGTLAAAGALLAQRASGQQTTPCLPRVDFHHHFQLAEIMAIDARAEAPPRIVPGTVARDLDDMDRFGTEAAIADRIRVRLPDDRGRGHEVGGCYAYARKCLER